MNPGLTSRVIAACALLAVLNATAFIVLLNAINEEHDQSQAARHVRSELSLADEVERSVARLHAMSLDYAITSDAAFATEWEQTRAEFESQARMLTEEVDEPELTESVRRAVDAADRYVAASSLTDQRSATSVADEQAAVDEVAEAMLDFRVTATALLQTRQQGSDDATRRGVIAAAIGLVGSLVLMACFAAYLLRAVLGPLRRASGMAQQLANGDLSVRMPETGRGEIGYLEQSFNQMGSQLEVARDELVRTADEQAALHRVAALVARRAEPVVVFSAVVDQLAELFGASSAVLLRYESTATAVVLAAHDAPAGVEAGTELALQNTPSTGVVTTAAEAGGGDVDRPAALARQISRFGLKSAVSAPIVVDAQPWGAVVVAWREDRDDLMTVGDRVQEFTKLVATAIANAEDRTKLAESRARVVTAGDQARRRIERDLHDGAQQRLVSLALELRLAQAKIPPDEPELAAEVGRLTDDVASVLTELQDLSRGIHPAILTQGGLAPALRALARRAALPVEVDVNDEQRLPEPVEIAAYYVVSEALTNAAKHADASVAQIDVRFGEHAVALTITDDGRGGAHIGEGSGLLGMQDRVEAAGGSIRIDSVHGRGTSIDVSLPVP